jgi:DNA-binding transcriptional regulator YiaG
MRRTYDVSNGGFTLTSDDDDPTIAREYAKRPRRPGMTPAEFTAWRTERGWTMPLMGRMLGVSTSTVSRWEGGSRTIPAWVPKLLATLE